MGNPLACAVANESLLMLQENNWQSQVANIEQRLKLHFKPFSALPQVNNVRVLGAIGVIELHNPVDMESIQAAFVAQGIWIRPFGKLVYIMPQYIVSNEELERLCSGMYNVISRL
jgi:adenosylmethionine-8-amino-7-oxononanoate aminotransferase